MVGCLVDMDERTVSFTLNGRGEEIGMGLAFSGEGFRPCGGVYACVSFNRREKLRLRLSEPFKYQPPPGYRGVGQAVMDAVEEREILAQKEQILDPSPDLSCQESKRFLCDFSDGEHGHELMAWAHRYYGSDASVHLGSGRSKQLSGSSKSSPVPPSESPAVACVSRRVEKAWSSTGKLFLVSNDEEEKISSDELSSQLKQGYDSASKELGSELLHESITMSMLFARKLILHLIVTLGDDFDLTCFGAESNSVGITRHFWKTVEMCASLRYSGWVGEVSQLFVQVILKKISCISHCLLCLLALSGRGHGNSC